MCTIGRARAGPNRGRAGRGACSQMCCIAGGNSAEPTGNGTGPAEQTRSRGEHGLKHPSYKLENVSHCFTARNRNLPTVSRNPSKRCPGRSFRDRCFLLGGAPPRLEAAPPDPFFQSIFARWTFEAAGSAEKLDFDSCGGQTRRRSSRRPSRPALPNA